MAIHFKNDEQKLSYALGLNFAMQITQLPLELDSEKFMAGFLDLIDGKEPAIKHEEFIAVLTELQERIEAEQKQEGGCTDCSSCGHDCGGSEHKKAGDEYREKNAKKEGVIVTKSGLQIEHLVQGSGKSPKATDKVRVHYVGKLIDGKVFDSSVDRGQPADFPLNQVIAGWTEGLQLLKEGGKAILTIPPEIAYGDSGAGSVIPPMATLIFEVELIKVF